MYTFFKFKHGGKIKLKYTNKKHILGLDKDVINLSKSFQNLFKHVITYLNTFCVK